MINEPIAYSLQGIEIISKTLAEKPDEIQKLFVFELNINTRVRAKDKNVMPFVSIRIKNGEGSELVGEIIVACIFEIPEFEKFIKINDQGLYIIPPHLEAAINPISISTTRGVMYSEFKGTYLHNAILPVITIQAVPAEQPSRKLEEKFRDRDKKKPKTFSERK